LPGALSKKPVGKKWRGGEGFPRKRQWSRHSGEKWFPERGAADTLTGFPLRKGVDVQRSGEPMVGNTNNIISIKACWRQHRCTMFQKVGFLYKPVLSMLDMHVN
jgi:hypothetical protein